MKHFNFLKAFSFAFACAFLTLGTAQTVTYSYTGSMQTYTVPAGVTAIQIEAFGAEGGSSTGESGGLIFLGGEGAYASGEFAVTPGQTIDILVGQRGGDGNCGSGGGGGSFVEENGTLLLVAGAGGGGFHCNYYGGIDGGNGLTTTAGGDGIATPAAQPGRPGGTNGNGGSAYFGGGGGGYLTDGVASANAIQLGFANPGAASADGNGGYGGGGGHYGWCCGGSGGGGGYSGGSGGDSDGCSGGGGGSYNIGTNQVMTDGGRLGDGEVVITVLCNASASAINADACDAYTVPSGDETYMVSGVYNDTIVNATGCDSVMTITVNITTIDNSTSIAGFTISATENGASYQWIDCNDNNAAIAGATSQDYTADANGDYAVIVTNNGCSDTSDCVTIAGVGIEEVNSEIKIFPNPTNELVTINANGNFNYTIANIAGDIILSGKGNNSETISLSDLAKGSYIVNVTVDGKVIITKLIKD